MSIAAPLTVTVTAASDPLHHRGLDNAASRRGARQCNCDCNLDVFSLVFLLTAPHSLGVQAAWPGAANDINQFKLTSPLRLCRELCPPSTKPLRASLASHFAILPGTARVTRRRFLSHAAENVCCSRTANNHPAVVCCRCVNIGVAGSPMRQSAHII
jgi:hypothetical protein